MPKYLLKGSFIFLLVIAAVVVGVYGIGAIVSTRLANNENIARAQGYTAGYNTGYEEGMTKGNEAGYQSGSKSGLIAAGGANETSINETGYFFMYNPTYSEIMTDLDTSEMSTSQQILDYAKANGIRAAYVRVPIARPASEGRIYLYQLVAFDTVDKGLIIIEPASHREVKVEVGKSYNALNGFPPSSFDDTITKVTMVW